jgi:hypothetical protein
MKEITRLDTHRRRSLLQIYNMNRKNHQDYHKRSYGKGGYKILTLEKMCRGNQQRID